MPTIQLKGYPNSSRLLIGEGLVDLARHIPVENPILITDSTVQKYYGNRFPKGQVIPIGIGESAKTLKTVYDLYDRLIRLQADRSSFMVGIGGGIVCDVAGFTASTFLRGVRFGLVATTLLAQVDAAIGGKNGVNFEGYKNMVGTIRQPEFVLCDPLVLKTLPEKEVSCGLAEIVKHAAIAHEPLLSFMENHAHEILALEPPILEKLIYESVQIKASIVEADEREAGERRKLNFGHTFGHAIETITGLPHGHAVSIGMVMAAGVSVQEGSLSKTEVQRLIRLLQRLDLPVAIDLESDRLFPVLGKDKKREGDGIHFVFLNRLGEARVERISMEKLKRLMSDIHGKS